MNDEDTRVFGFTLFDDRGEPAINLGGISYRDGNMWIAEIGPPGSPSERAMSCRSRAVAIIRVLGIALGIPRADFTEVSEPRYWCRRHHREATAEDDKGNPCCDPNLRGVAVPCETISIDAGDFDCIPLACSVAEKESNQ